MILIGYMGSGKSTLGCAVSYPLQQCLIDTDKWIEQKEGMTVSEIFAVHGEAYFRQKETECLETMLLEKEPRVLALGGGTPLLEENRRLMKQLGFTVYLQAQAETIYDRLKEDTTRPLLQCDNPRAKIEQMIGERDPIYRQAADYILQVDDWDIKRLVRELQEAYRAVKNRNDGFCQPGGTFYSKTEEENEAAGDQRAQS
ncbi:MAG: shikimate kinase [Lachnospiraceae bacterium]|nr:shikimate kinase [Lachnospiraceae bacterium]